MEKILDSKQKGILTELQCITAFNELGYHISIPYGENSRYDFIADIDGKLIRVQVKASSKKEKNADGTISFSCRSTHSNSSGNISRTYTKNEIDYFATYYNSVCYLIPVEECSTEKTLRFEPPANGQTKGITFAKDYELSVQINKIKEER